MFSGSIPFQGKRDHHVINSISQGRRPERPIDPRSQTRGLTDHIWEMIVTCWHQQPEKRFTAEQVVNCLHALPNRPLDNRLLDNYSMPPPSRMMYKQAQHPFSILEMIAEQAETGAPFVPGLISQMFGLEDSWDHPDGEVDAT